MNSLISASFQCTVLFSVSWSTPCRDRNEHSPSKALKRAAVTQPFTIDPNRGETEVCLDLNGNIHSSRPVAVRVWGGAETPSCCGEDETELEDAEIGLEKSRCWISRGKKLTWSHTFQLVGLKLKCIGLCLKYSYEYIFKGYKPSRFISEIFHWIFSKKEISRCFVFIQLQ